MRGISVPRWTLQASTIWAARTRADGVDDALAHAFDVDRQRRRILEDARARRFRRLGEPERIVERMDVEGARQMHGVEIMLAPEHVAHALGRPALDLGAELLADRAATAASTSSPLSTLETLSQPAIGATPGMRASAIVGADVFETHLGERPQRLGVIESDAADDPVHALGKARKDETVVASGRVPGEAARFPAQRPTSRDARSRARS